MTVSRNYRRFQAALVRPGVVLLRVLPYLPACCTFGCFEVREVPTDPADEPRSPPLLIDDFEDGDPRPSAGMMEPWRCDAFEQGPDMQPVACGPAPEGYGSDRGYSLWFELRDAFDGVDDYPVAQLFAPIPIPFDVNAYSELLFSHRYVEGDIPLPSAVFMQVSLHCDANADAAQTIEDVVPLFPDWHHSALPLANFVQPEWQESRVDTADCAARIDQLNFEIKGFSDGQAASGTLLLDDVYLR